MANIARLGVALGLNSAEFVSGIDAATRKLDQFATAAVGVGKNALLALGAALSVATYKAISYADQIQDVAAANDIAIDSVIKLTNALENSGGKGDNAVKMLSSFTDFVDKAAKGSFEGQKTFNQLGISLKDIGSMSTQDLLLKTTEAIAGMQDPLTRNARAADAFGKAAKGVDMVDFAKGLREGKGATLEQEQAIKDAAQAFDLFKSVGRDISLLITETLGPSLLKLGKYLKDLDISNLSFTIFGKFIGFGSGNDPTVRIVELNKQIADLGKQRELALGRPLVLSTIDREILALQREQDALIAIQRIKADELSTAKQENKVDDPKREVKTSKEVSAKIFELEKLRLQNEFAIISNLENDLLSKEKQAKLEQEKAYAEARLEIKQKNISEENEFATSNASILAEKLKLIDKDYSEKIAAAQNKYKQEGIRKGFEMDKASLENYYSSANKFLSEYQLIDLEYQKKLAEAKDEHRQKNITENGQFELQNAITLATKKLTINAEYEDKRKALARKRNIEEATQQMAASEEADKAFAAQSNFYQQGNLAMWKKQDLEKTALSRSQEMFKLEQKGRYLKAEELQQEKEILQQQWKHKDALAEIIAMENLDRSSREEAIERENNFNQKALDSIRERGRILQEQKSGSVFEGFMFKMDTFGKNMETNFEAGGKAFDSLMNGMTKALEDFVSTGKLNFEDFAKAIIKDMLAIQLRASATNLFSMLAKSVAGAFSGTPTIPMQPGGGYADGGDPPVGVPSMVGERGPELFVPKTAGTIVPNHMLGSSQQAPTINYNGPYIASLSAIDTQSGLQFLAKNKQSVWSVYQSANRSIPMSR